MYNCTIQNDTLMNLEGKTFPPLEIDDKINDLELSFNKYSIRLEKTSVLGNQFVFKGNINSLFLCYQKKCIQFVSV